jgi:osmotically inducible protein OsmC
MPTRTSRTAWDGDLFEGSGQVEFTSSGLGTFNVSWPRRTDDGNDGTGTTPEELVAAAHSSCFSMALSNEVKKAGGTPIRSQVTAEVNFGPDPAGGFQITGITLIARSEVDGLDDAAYQDAAQRAKEGCPISKALAATAITLDAALESA